MKFPKQEVVNNTTKQITLTGDNAMKECNIKDASVDYG